MPRTARANGSTPPPMDARRQTTTARGRLYEWHGENFWSVTTIIKGGLPAPQLLEWTASEVARFAVANHRQLSAMLQTVRMEAIERRLESGLTDVIRERLGLRPPVLGPRGGEKEPGAPVYIVREDPDAIAGAVSWLRNSPYRDKERKADIGKAVHAELEAYALDKPRPEPPIVVREYVQQFRLFLEAFRPRIIASEATVYSRRESYAGRLDAIMEFDVPVASAQPDGSPTVIVVRAMVDYKTGKGVYSETALQLSAYARAEFVGLTDGSEQPVPHVDIGAALHLRPDGWALIPCVIDDEVWNAFRYVRETFRFREETGKQVLGSPVLGPEGLAWIVAGGEPIALPLLAVGPVGVEIEVE